MIYIYNFATFFYISLTRVSITLVYHNRNLAFSYNKDISEAVFLETVKEYYVNEGKQIFLLKNLLFKKRNWQDSV